MSHDPQPGAAPKPPLFRIAIRTEGAMVNAYFAKPHTMEGAVLIGSFSRRICAADPALFDAFQSLMQRGVALASREALGGAPVRFDTQAAPEHEKAGHA